MTLQDLREADALGSELYTDSGVTGLVLVVVRGDQVFIRGYGETAPGSHVAPSENSVVRLCSLTKIFTSDLLTKLVADGTVKLDDPLAEICAPGRAPSKNDAPITLFSLATHTSGFDREIGTAPRRTPHFTYPDYATRWQWLPSAQLKFTPGTQAWYSNIGYDLLSDALANAAHTSYPTLLWSRTLSPLDMWQTTFYPSAEQCERLMQGAHNEGPCTVTENTQGSSGLYSTPADMAKWLRYLAGPAKPGQATQPDAAHAVYLLVSRLKSIFGLNHAGRPAGIGLGWMHLGADDDPVPHHREDRRRSRIQYLYRDSSSKPHGFVRRCHRRTAAQEKQPSARIPRVAWSVPRIDQRIAGARQLAAYARSCQETSSRALRAHSPA